MSCYIETWEVSGNPDGDMLVFAYTEEELQYGLLETLYNAMEDMHECKLERLLRVDRIERKEKGK